MKLSPVGFFLFIAVILLSASAMFISCNAGLAPPAPSEQAVLTGTIHFPKRWPASDSVNLLAVVLIQPTPPFSDSTLIKGLNTTVIPISLAYLSPDTTYKFTVPAGHYGYLGVAHNYNLNELYSAWRVDGFAHDAKDSALSFDLKGGTTTTGVDITVTFDSLPRQPFIP